MAFVSRITIYPIKALGGTDVESIEISAGGSLLHDREIGICNSIGKFMNGKLTPRVHTISSDFDQSLRHVSLAGKVRGPETIALSDSKRLAAWFSAHFQEPVEIVRNEVSGLPDDTVAWGPTIVSAASLQRVASWFENMTQASARARFRANIEIDGVDAFWEDCLFAGENEVVDFRIGSVRFRGLNPCQRCIVPARDPSTGDVKPGFQKIFAKNRKNSLAVSIHSERFDHFYRLAVNTQIPPAEAGKKLQVGDELEIVSVRRSA